MTTAGIIAATTAASSVTQDTSTPVTSPSTQPQKKDSLFAAVTGVAIGVAVSVAIGGLTHLGFGGGKGARFKWTALSREHLKDFAWISGLSATFFGTTNFTNARAYNRSIDKDAEITHLQRVIAEKDQLMSAARAKS